MWEHVWEAWALCSFEALSPGDGNVRVMHNYFDAANWIPRTISLAFTPQSVQTHFRVAIRRRLCDWKIIAEGMQHRSNTPFFERVGSESSFFLFFALICCENINRKSMKNFHIFAVAARQHPTCNIFQLLWILLSTFFAFCASEKKEENVHFLYFTD